MGRLVLLAMIMVLCGAGGAGARSLALIIGNDSYVSVPKLSKARSDAAGYAALFESQGFVTQVFTDLDSKGATFALAGFLDMIEPGDTVAFVFSGHGWSDGRENYLLPVDIPLTGSEALFQRQSIAVQNGVNGIVDEIVGRGAKLTLVIIDACRNNPFNSGDRTRAIGVARGLVGEIAPEGTFIAFSAGAGQTALDALSDDDVSPYSVFTRHFLQELRKPQDLQSAFKATQREVSEVARTIGHDQRPAYYDEVIGKACLSGSCTAAPAPAAPPATPPVAAADPNARMQLALQSWEYFKDSNDVTALAAFAEEFADTPIATLAEARIRALEAAGTPPAPPVAKDTGNGTGNGGGNGSMPTDLRNMGTPGTGARPDAPLAPRGTGPRPDWCPRAQTTTEIAICETPLLAEKDVLLSRLYAAKRSGTSGLAREALVQDQRAWLADRDRCRAEVRCMDRLYTRRIEELRY